MCFLLIKEYRLNSLKAMLFKHDLLFKVAKVLLIESLIENVYKTDHSSLGFHFSWFFEKEKKNK